MSNTTHHNRSKMDRILSGERFKSRDIRPRENRRRQGTRAAVVATAKREA